MFTKESLDRKKTDKRHILFLINSLRFGGAERVLINLLRYFIKTGRYHISLMLLEEGVDFDIPGEIKITALHHRQRNLFDKFYSLAIDSIRLKRFVREKDVDIVLSFMQRPNAINMLSKAIGSRHSTCVSVRVYLRKHYERVWPPIKAIGKAILTWLWRYTDRTIVNSFAIKDDLIGLFKINPAMIEAIHNPLDFDEIKALSMEPVTEECFIGKRKGPVVVNVARFAKEKGQVYLLRAFAFLVTRRPAYLVFIGDGKFKDDIERQSKELNISNRVLFLGNQKNPYKYVTRSDVFVLPSLYEGFPNAVTEAMACRCPVVVSNCLSGPSEILLPQKKDDKGDIVETEYGIMFNDRSERTLSKAIERILDNKDMADKYSDIAYERAKVFDLPTIGRGYERALSEALNTKEKRDITG